MTTKFTPGPWLLGHTPATKNMVYIDDEAGSRVADCQSAGFGIKGNEKKYNAHLIAAAPDMYEALEMVLLSAKRSPTHTPSPKTFHDVEAALAKARGEP